jgi:hypothetical protein
MVETDELMEQIVNDETELKPPLNPRDALSGVRTNAIALYYKGVSDYVDFTSLYPYVQKYGIFLFGHPQVITENFENKDSYYGLIFCIVTPPRKLYHPVVPLQRKTLFSFMCNLC